MTRGPHRRRWLVSSSGNSLPAHFLLCLQSRVARPESIFVVFRTTSPFLLQQHRKALCKSTSHVHLLTFGCSAHADHSQTQLRTYECVLALRLYLFKMQPRASVKSAGPVVLD